MKCRIDGQIYELPDSLVEQLHLRRYRDRRKRPNIISIRFSNEEMEFVHSCFLKSPTWLPFSSWLHDLLLDILKRRTIK